VSGETPEIARLRQDLVFDVELPRRPRSLRLRSTWGLFSPRGLDDGSRLLLDHFNAEPEDDSLDLGCGYGPLGLALAGDSPQGMVTMIDRDFLAVEYANANAIGNGLTNASARLGHGFVGLEADARWDNIVSNLPAKTGGELLRLLLHDAHHHLRPGGRLCVVTVTGLRRFIERHLREQFGNYDKLKQSKSYTVALAVRD
jgi:16S rRNA G1207 methylase RsmC